MDGNVGARAVAAEPVVDERLEHLGGEAGVEEDHPGRDEDVALVALQVEGVGER